MFKYSLLAVSRGKYKNKIYKLKKSMFIKNPSKSFDYAILEKTNDINV